MTTTVPNNHLYGCRAVWMVDFARPASFSED